MHATVAVQEGKCCALCGVPLTGWTRAGRCWRCYEAKRPGGEISMTTLFDAHHDTTQYTRGAARLQAADAARRKHLDELTRDGPPERRGRPRIASPAPLPEPELELAVKPEPVELEREPELSEATDEDLDELFDRVAGAMPLPAFEPPPPEQAAPEEPMDQVKTCPYCGKKLRSHNMRGACSKCIAAGKARAAPGEPRPMKPPPRAPEVTGEDLSARFNVVAQALGLDPEALLNGFRGKWLGELREKLGGEAA